MRISVIGCGHLGAPHAAALAEMGHEVVGVDLDPAKVEALQAGRAWFYEADLDDLLAKHTASGRLRFTTDIVEAARFATVHFLGVGTPIDPATGGYDMRQVFGSVEALAPHLDRPCLIVGKSTVTVGTVEKLTARAAELAPVGSQAEVAWNPEFLREGHAVEDSLRPERIVLGVSSSEAEKVLREVYAPILDGPALIVTDPATSEVIKGAGNSYLAMKVSWANALADLCSLTGADVKTVVDALGMDARIGRSMLTPGLGYGGGCLPKDVRAFATRAREIGAHHTANLLDVSDRVNASRPKIALELVAEAVGDVQGKRVAMWGVSFKPGTDDTRESPAVTLAGLLRDAGAELVLFDPRVSDLPGEWTFAGTAEEAAQEADLVVLATDWPQFAALDPGKVPAGRQLLVDVRNQVDRERWHAAGWSVYQIGRPALMAPEE